MSMAIKCFHVKIRIIQKIRKDIKIIILPVLPNRLADMNRHVVCYNQILWQQYSASCPSFNIRIPGLYEFLDEEGLLRRDLAKFGDYIHLSVVGMSRLAVIIKETIFNRTSNSGVGKSSPQVRRHQLQSRPS